MQMKEDLQQLTTGLKQRMRGMLAGEDENVKEKLHISLLSMMIIKMNNEIQRKGRKDNRYWNQYECFVRTYRDRLRRGNKDDSLHVLV